jgi:catechol 2,3-dioxygenase-like lactoylglutathione lyase family enzyme
MGDLQIPAEVADDLRLIHVGLVCRDMSSAQDRLSRLLNVHWVGGDREEWPLVLYGSPKKVDLRIAHASDGHACFELIEAVPDTPWLTDREVIQHHLCFYSQRSEEVCKYLENNQFDRIMGRHGDPSGYFQDPTGLLIEIIDDNLRAYLEGFYRDSLEKRG